MVDTALLTLGAIVSLFYAGFAATIFVPPAEANAKPFCLENPSVLVQLRWVGSGMARPLRAETESCLVPAWQLPFSTDVSRCSDLRHCFRGHYGSSPLYNRESPEVPDGLADHRSEEGHGELGENVPTHNLE